MQAERRMQAGPDIALAGAWAATRKGSLQQRQKLSRGRAKTCDQVVLVALPLILHVKVFRSRSCSLLLVSDQFQFASLQLSRTHQSRWRSFVFGLFLWLFVYRFYLYFLLFIIIFYQRHRSQTHTHTHTGTQTGLPCYAASCLGYTAQNQAQLFQFAFAHALEADFISYYK